LLKFAFRVGMKGDLLDSKDESGDTPLHLAISKKYTEMSKKLISEGADLFLM